MSYQQPPPEPAPPSYYSATSGYPPPPKEGVAYPEDAPIRTQGGTHYVEVPQHDASGFTNPGYNHAAPTAPGYPPPSGGYPPPQAGGYPPAQAGGYPPAQAGGYPPPQPGYNAGAPPPATYNAQQMAPPGMEAEAAPSDNSSANEFGGDFTGNSFSNKAIRRGFIRKVYMILMAQLLVTVGIICFFIFHQPTKQWITQRGGSWFYYCAYAVFIVTYIALVCCPTVRRKSPGNFICLAVFTLAFSYMAGTLSCFHDTNIVLIAIGITSAVCLAISIFACQTKIDFTMCSGLLFALLMVLFFFGWACLIVYLVIGPSQILSCVYAGLGALVFSLFLAYDTQMLMGGRKYEISSEEYIFGSLQLYLDIVYIFIFIMSLAGSSKG